MEIPFTRDEKRFVLAEVLKQSLSLEKLLDIVRNENIREVNWSEMILPPGRNSRMSAQVFDELMNFVGGPNRHSGVFEAYNPPTIQMTRPAPLHSFSPHPPVRQLKPKPAPSSEPGASALRTSVTGSKKRGRPSNAVLAARAAQRQTIESITSPVERTTYSRPPGQAPTSSIHSLLSASSSRDELGLPPPASTLTPKKPPQQLSTISPKGPESSISRPFESLEPAPDSPATAKKRRISKLGPTKATESPSSSHTRPLLYEPGLPSPDQLRSPTSSLGFQPAPRKVPVASPSDDELQGMADRETHKDTVITNIVTTSTTHEGNER